MRFSGRSSMQQRDEAGTLLDRVFTALACFELLGLAAMCTFVLPRFEGVFEDIGSGNLPGLTRLFLSVPRLAWIPAALILCAALFGKGLVIRRARTRVNVAVAAFAVALLAVGAYVMGTHLPLLRIVEEIEAS
jgi:type II secretory pathway component PulF